MMVATAVTVAAGAYSAYSASESADDAQSAQQNASMANLIRADEAAANANTLNANATAQGIAGMQDSSAAANQALTGGTTAANNALQGAYGNIESLTSTWRNIGDMAVDRMMNTEEFSFDRDFDFSAEAFEKYKDPSYDWRVEQGVNAMDQSAASRGNVQSGAQSKALANYGQEMGSQEYQNAFNRYAQEYDRDFNKAKSIYDTNMNMNMDRDRLLAGYGNNATNTLANASQQYGTGSANNLNQLGINQSNNLSNLGVNTSNALIGSATQRGSNLANAAVGTAGAVSDYGQAAADNAISQGNIANNVAENALLAYETYAGTNPTDDLYNQF